MHPSSECANHSIFGFQHFLRTAMWGCRWVCCQELVRGGEVLRCSSCGKPHNLSNHKITKVRAWVCPRTGAMGRPPNSPNHLFFSPSQFAGVFDSWFVLPMFGTWDHPCSKGFFVALLGDDLHATCQEGLTESVYEHWMRWDRRSGF